MLYGYTGKILHVDLTSAKITIEEPSEDFYRKYMGGSTLNLYYMLKEMPAGADPLGPENILALSVGAATGTSISGQSRVTATAKSPLTGTIGDSQSGGYWAAELKFAGFDAVIIRGKSPSPVYLWIHDGEAELKDASRSWGKITGEAESIIKEELNDPKVKILQIGPAGEKLVRFAALVHMCNRVNGRTGMGAVMGSKNLKAVVVRGKNRPKPADETAFKELSKWGATTFPKSMLAGVGKYGTAASVDYQNSVGGQPTFNYNSGVFEGAKSIGGFAIYKTLLKGREEGKQDTLGRETCYGCVVRCKRVVQLNEGPYPLDDIYGGPEFESVSTLGSYCGIDNLAAITKANQICNQYGMDTMSCGATVAWAMEAFEEGQLSQKDTDGLELTFGNAEALVLLVEKIGRREGFGNVLAEGSAKAAEQLNLGKNYLITCKGLEAAAHMPQIKRGLGLIYAVNPYGADHSSTDHDPNFEVGFERFRDRLESLGLTGPQAYLSLGSEKIRCMRISQYIYSLTDTLCVCQLIWGPTFHLFGPEHMVQLVQSVTGWDVTLEELLEIAERRVNMMRVFNAREGMDRTHDQLPQKFFERALTGGPSDGIKLDRDEYESAKTEYYRQCGWDEQTGNPTRETLDRLGLEWL